MVTIGAYSKDMSLYVLGMLVFVLNKCIQKDAKIVYAFGIEEKGIQLSVTRSLCTYY